MTPLDFSGALSPAGGGSHRTPLCGTVPQQCPPSHSVAKNENGVSCSGWIGSRVSFTQIHRAVSGTCVPGTFRGVWRKEAVSELPIMEPGGILAFDKPSPFHSIPRGARG